MEYLRNGDVSHEAFDRVGNHTYAERFYYPPTQRDSTRKPWSYNGLIAEWDKLPMQKVKYHEQTSEGYDLYHYIYNPNNQENVFFIQAGIHGNEMCAKQNTLKLFQMITSDDNAWQVVKNMYKWVIIPCVNPWGHDNSNMNVPYNDVTSGMNLNRNLDYLHQYSLAQAGVGGVDIWEKAETRHIKWCFDTYKPIKALDFHDGESVMEHLWLNYSSDGLNRNTVDSIVEHLIERLEIENPVIPHCGDFSNGTGTASMYFAKSMGIAGSVNEWVGGYLGYDFKSDMMTKSLEVRGNMIRCMAYDDYTEEYEPRKDGNYWQWEYSPSATVKGLQKNTAYRPLNLNDYYDKWEELDGIKKSYGMNTDSSHEVSTYKFGRGSKKVLFIGGVMRWGGYWQHTSYAMYRLIEASLKGRFGDVLDRYTFVICPAIDLNGNNGSVNARACGLNNSALTYKKFENGSLTTYGQNARDVQILTNIINDNSDARIIISGGERMEGYAGNNQTKYTTDCVDHIAIPNKLGTNILNGYIEPVTIEHTGGDTFGDWCDIPTYFIDRRPDAEVFATRNTGITLDDYSHCNREIAHTVTLILNVIESLT